MDNKKIKEFLKESNYIEREYGELALKDAIKAWDFAYKNKDNINLSVILEIHNILMKNLNPRIAGRLRTCSVRIGAQVKLFVNLQLLEEDLKKFIKEYNSLTKGSPKKAHIHFEDIHPFEDGNGRVGRILMLAHRINLGLPILVIKESEKYDYYEWFQ